jgi:hypothetical protein
MRGQCAGIIDSLPCFAPRRGFARRREEKRREETRGEVRGAERKSKSKRKERTAIINTPCRRAQNRVERERGTREEGNNTESANKS